MSRRPLDATILVHGIGITNRAAARALVSRGHSVVLSDDGDPGALEDLAHELTTGSPGASVEVLERPDRAAFGRVLTDVGSVLPTPGLADRHPLLAAADAAGSVVLSEFDLAAEWDDRPVAAITGTNGKTTVTTLVDEMLRSSGVTSRAVGNLETPLVEAIEDPRTEVFVVEASSFRLGRSHHVAPAVGTWLNFAEDHLDVHGSLELYRLAKARIWAEQTGDDLSIGNAEDPVVAAELERVRGTRRTLRFGLAAEVDGRAVEYHESGGWLMAGPERLVESSALWSTLPHDRANALAAAATASGVGATVEGLRCALDGFGGLAHRVELVAESAGVRWYDDSKATAPHATLAALAGLDDVVLIAGGRNKGLDLSVLGSAGGAVRAVVGIGESAGAVVAAFPGTPSATASSMDEAVELAASWARPGVAVLLSPGCASFDWYGSYSERGDDFARAVRERVKRSIT